MCVSPSRPCPAPTVSSCIPDERFSRTCHLVEGCPSPPTPPAPARPRGRGAPPGCSPRVPPPRAPLFLEAAPPLHSPHPRPALWPPPQRFAARQRGNSFPPGRNGRRRPRPPGLAAAGGGVTRGRGADRAGPAVCRGGSGLSSPSAPPGQRGGRRAAAASPFVSRSLLSPPLQAPLSSSNAPLLPLFSSLLLRPRAPPPLAPKLSPSSQAQSALPRPPHSGVSPVGPPSPAPPGLLMPRPVGRVPAGLHIPCPGPVGLGLFIILSAAGSSAPVPLPPHSPRLAGASGRQGAETPPPHTHLSVLRPAARTSRGAARRGTPLWVTAWRGTTGRGTFRRGAARRGAA